jgi:predicted TIM-barrel fold metal-dependent hydrolase
MDATHVSQAVVIQPGAHGYENRYVADCIRHHPHRLAGIARVEPSRPDVAARLRILLQEEGFRGFRLNLLQAHELRAWQNQSLWEAAATLGAVVTLLIDPPHLPDVAIMARRFPNVPVVVDHLARIRPWSPGVDDAQRSLLAMAALPNVYVKVSAFQFLSQEPFPWRDLHSLIAAVAETYAPQRLMWGSDFPLIPHAYAESLRLVCEFPSWSDDDRTWLLHRTAATVFKLPRVPQAR